MRKLLFVALVACAAKDAKPAARKVSLASQPIQAWLGLPMSGDVEIVSDVENLEEPAKANGTLRITCAANCRLGDDKATIASRAKQPELLGGMYFGHIDFDSFAIEVDVANGKGTITKFDVASKEVVMKLGGTFELARPLADSRLDLCLRFDGTEALRARDPKTYAVVMMTGAQRANDGLFSIKLEDKASAPKRLAAACGTDVTASR